MEQSRHSESFSARVRHLGLDPTSARAKMKKRIATPEQFIAALAEGNVDELPMRFTGRAKGLSQATQMSDAGVSPHSVRYAMRRYDLDFDAALKMVKEGLPKRVAKAPKPPAPRRATARGEAQKLGVKETEVRILARYTGMSFRDAAQRIRDTLDGVFRPESPAISGEAA